MLVEDVSALDEESDVLLLLAELGVLDEVVDTGFVVVPDWEREGVLVVTGLLEEETVV